MYSTLVCRLHLISSIDAPFMTPYPQSLTSICWKVICYVASPSINSLILIIAILPMAELPLILIMFTLAPASWKTRSILTTPWSLRLFLLKTKDSLVCRGCYSFCERAILTRLKGSTKWLPERDRWPVRVGIANQGWRREEQEESSKPQLFRFISFRVKEVSNKATNG